MKNAYWIRLSQVPPYTYLNSYHKDHHSWLWFCRNRKLLQPFTSIANLIASSFSKYESGIGIMHTKKSKRAKSRSTHSPPYWVWNNQYLESAIPPPINSSNQDMTVTCIPIMFLLRRLILDSSVKDAKMVSLHSDLIVY